MADQEKKGNLPKGDSGYVGGEGSVAASPPRAVMHGVQQQKVRLFTKCISQLSSLELSGSEDKRETQMEELNRYLSDIIDEEPAIIKEECHFKVVDYAVKDSLTPTKLEDNEGSAFLAIARSCLNIEVLEKVLAIISIEQDGQKKEDLLKKYSDIDGYNILHCLADLIVKKHEHSLPITNKNEWRVFHHFAGLVPELKGIEALDRTPDDILIEAGLAYKNEEERTIYQEVFILTQARGCTFL